MTNEKGGDRSIIPWGVKAILLALFVGLLMVGCGESSTHSDSSKAIDLDIDFDDSATRDRIGAEAIDDEKVQRRGKEGEALYYVRNQQTPYTGWMRKIDKKGQTTALVEVKDGKFEGLGFEGLVDGQNGGGAICKEKFTSKNGKLHGPLMRRYENGQKKRETTYKDDKLVTAVAWKPNGEKCPVTNVKDGNGVRVRYKEDGTALFRETYKDGEEVKD